MFQPSSDPASTEYSEVDVCYRRLWMHVVLRAVEDSEGRDLMYDNDYEAPVLEREAMRWLTVDSEDFRLVCEWADVDGDRLLEMSRRRKYGQSDSEAYRSI